MNGNAIGIGCATNTGLQHATLVNAAVGQFTLDLDTVVNAEEDFEAFGGGSHLDLCCAYVFSTEKDAGISAQQYAVARVDNCGSQVNILFQYGSADVIKGTGKIVMSYRRLVRRIIRRDIYGATRTKDKRGSRLLD